MTDRAADDRLGDTTTNHQWRAAAAALAATETAAAMAEARVMAAVKVMRTSNDDENDDATTQRRDNADDANHNADGESGKELTTRLPGGRGGCTTRIAGWAARRTASSGCHRALPPRRRRWPLALGDQLVLRHGFVPANRPAPPPAMMMTRTRTAASKEQQWRWPPATQERRDAPVASGRRHNHQ